MKKILVLVNVLVIVAICVGGYMFIKNNEKSSQKINELENEIATLKSEENVVTNMTTNEEKNESKNSNTSKNTNTSNEKSKTNSKNNTTQNNDVEKKVDNDNFDNSKIGEWKSEEEYNYNVKINKIEGDKVYFDWGIYRLTSFDNLVATIADNKATFNTNNVDNGEFWYGIYGTFYFKDGKMYFKVDKSECEYMIADIDYNVMVK